MTAAESNRYPFNPSPLFYAGLGLVMLSLWLFFVPEWRTFMHSWRVKLFASAFLLLTLSYLFIKAKQIDFRIGFSADERRFVLFPIIAFTLWSAASLGWAPSWTSAVHHTLMWAEYLLFFCLIRHILEQNGHYRKLVELLTLTLMIYALPAVAGYSSFLVFGGSLTLGTQYARFGEQVLSITPLLIAGVLTLGGRRFIVGVASITMLWLLIFCSLGRTNIVLYMGLILAITALIFTVRSFHKFRRKMAVIAAVLVIAPASLHLLTFFSAKPEVPMVKRLTEKEVISGSNNFRKLMIAISAEMISHHPIIGVGADNFGFETNRYREIYAAKHPDAPGLDQAESEIPERAHNEYLQILAELGIVGGAIFGWFLAGAALIGYRSLRGLGRQPLHAPAAALGLGLFLVSSLVTSYSFRLMQNGFVFFFVLAVASKLLLKKDDDKAEAALLSPAMLRFACTAGIAVCLFFSLYWVSKVSSVIITDQASQTREFDAAAELFRRAMQLDVENPRARNNFGMRLFWEERYAEAVPYLREAIEMGSASSSSFSYLATAQKLSGDHTGAELTMKAAARLYPQSVFVLTRYSILLDENGKPEESRATFDRALSIDRTAANTWRAMILSGAHAASRLAVNGEEYDQVMDLKPRTAMYAVLYERLIRFPEDQRYSLIMLPSLKKPTASDE